MKRKFVLCIDNKENESSLVPKKIYEVIPDPKAERDDFLRLVDESGEDYLHHKSHFVFVELPAEVERVLLAA